MRRSFAVLLIAAAFASARCAHRLPVVDALIYNIHAGRDASGADNLERVASLIRTSGAEIVLLQEVDRGTTRSGGVDQLAVLMKRTGLHGVFGKSLDYQGGEYGIAVLSRWPITSSKVVPLHTDPPQPRAGGNIEPRVALVVRSGGMTIVNTHLDASREETWRLQETQQLLQLEPDIAGGDFNAEPGSHVYGRLVAAGYRDSWRECGEGEGLTFSSSKPVKRIDYLLLRGGIRCTSADVIETDASDHRPLLVTIESP